MYIKNPTKIRPRPWRPILIVEVFIIPVNSTLIAQVIKSYSMLSKKCGRVKPVNWMPTLPCICNQCLSSLKFYFRLWHHVLIDTILFDKYFSLFSIKFRHMYIKNPTKIRPRPWRPILIVEVFIIPVNSTLIAQVIKS
jgi:hypothetical protein